MRHFAGLTYREIALELRVPEATVKSRLFEARQRLAEALAAWS
jgi:DNA-directed RNA polymerase specialized sigma24 family protein